jgi:hypothetical protein
VDKGECSRISNTRRMRRIGWNAISRMNNTRRMRRIGWNAVNKSNILNIIEMSRYCGILLSSRQCLIGRLNQRLIGGVVGSARGRLSLAPPFSRLAEWGGLIENTGPNVAP